MRTQSLRAALRQEVRRAVSRQGKVIGKRLDRARARLRSLRLAVRRQAAEIARAQRRLAALRAGRTTAGRGAAGPSGPRMSPKQIRAARGPRSRRAFAEILGVSANSIFLWETGRARPRGVNVARLQSASGGARRGPGRPRGSRTAGTRTTRARTARRKAARRPARRRTKGARKAA